MSADQRKRVGAKACLKVAWAMAWAVAATSAHAALVFEGSAGLETRWFLHAPAAPEQAQHAAIGLFNPVWKLDLPGQAWRATLNIDIRLDTRDSSSRFVDISEASIHHTAGDVVWRAGIDKVFWGVAESVHLIDVINQVDPRISIELDAKLGQPMASVATFTDRFGRLEAFWLPVFRERPDQGPTSRQRLPGGGMGDGPPGLGRARRSDDWAVRWSGTVPGMNADVGLYYFQGLGREPVWRGPVPQPSYLPMRQVGLQAQWPVGNTLWKGEALHREGHGKAFLAYVAGGEYTVSLQGGDLGLLIEWARDHRDGNAPPTRFARSGFAGLRYRFNETGDSELRMGVLRDTLHHASMYKLEFSRRFAEHYQFSLIARKVQAPRGGPYTPLLRDDNVQITIRRLF